MTGTPGRASSPIDAVLATLPDDQRRALQDLRETSRFTPDKPLPKELVTKLVRARVAETDERWG